MIKIVYDPCVYLVARSREDELAVDAFLFHNQVDQWRPITQYSAERIVETAGRLCYMSYDKPRPGGSRAYIEHILEVGHGSVLEHAVFSFMISGVSRTLTHELVRHRAGMSYSQLSQRYVDSSDVAFVAPPALIDDIREAEKTWVEPHDLFDLPTPGQTWIQHCENSLYAYDELSDHLSKRFSGLDKTSARKAARESARSVLPGCTETKIFVTANARSLRHFLTLRGSLHADAEIRRLASTILSIVRCEAPNIFGDFSEQVAPDGRTFLTSEFGSI